MKAKRVHFGFFTLIVFFLVTGSGPFGATASGQGPMYQEFDGILLFYIPKEITVYRELLPPVFDLPQEPLVQVFVIDYYKMAPWALEPYREAAIFLLARYKGEEVWHCITMPVTSDRARIGGIRHLGYPKVLAEVVFTRAPHQFNGLLSAQGKTIMEIVLDTRGHVLTEQERNWFHRLAGTPSLNLRNGQLVDPMPGTRRSRTSMLDLAQRMPDLFQVQTGKATLRTQPENAPQAQDWRPKAFGIEVKEIVLAYYFQNKYGFSFGIPKVVSE